MNKDNHAVALERALKANNKIMKGRPPQVIEAKPVNAPETPLDHSTIIPPLSRSGFQAKVWQKKPPLPGGLGRGLRQLSMWWLGLEKAANLIVSQFD